MNDQDTRNIESGQRCVQWFSDYTSLILVPSIFQTRSVTFTGLVTDLQTIAGDHEASASAGFSATVIKGTERQDLLDSMDPARNAARMAEFENPGMRDRYRYTVDLTDENLLARGRAFVTNGAADDALLVSYTAPAGWVTAISDACDAFQATFGQQSSAKGAAVAANAEFRDKMDKMMQLKAFFSHGIKNLAASDPGAHAAWHTAAHVELAPKKKKNP
jgi:hypothetical protein